MIPYEIYPVEAVVYLLVAINKKCTRTSTEYVKICLIVLMVYQPLFYVYILTKTSKYVCTSVYI